jgi:hypothetical protein
MHKSTKSNNGLLNPQEEEVKQQAEPQQIKQNSPEPQKRNLKQINHRNRK